MKLFVKVRIFSMYRYSQSGNIRSVLGIPQLPLTLSTTTVKSRIERKKLSRISLVINLPVTRLFTNSGICAPLLVPSSVRMLLVLVLTGGLSCLVFPATEVFCCWILITNESGASTSSMLAGAFAVLSGTDLASHAEIR